MNKRLVISMAMLLPLLDGQTSTWRPVVMGDQGMVVSGHPLASEAGVRILKSGGNAVDAAIATWAAQGLVEPMMTGLGSDMFVMIYIAKTHEVKFINATGFAPMAATIDLYKSKGGIPMDGALSVSVPGSVGGAELAVEKYGTKPLADVLAPAVELAERGVPVTEHLANSLKTSEKMLARFPSSSKIWFHDGKPAQFGDRVVQKDLAATLRTIGSQGSKAFYQGPIAKMTAAYMQANGGLITEQDLAKYQAFEDAPIRINYRGVDVYECPPNSQGMVMLEALNILEGFNLRYMGHNSAPYLHLVTEALKLSFADRNKYIGDPKFVPPIPMRELLSKEYAATRRAAIDPLHAIEGEPAPGNPRQASSSSGQAYAMARPVPEDVGPAPENTWGLTTYLAVVDKDHNMVSITSSLLSGFGSGMVVENGGFFLNNRMAYFYLDPAKPNGLAPGKRTRQTINPALALKDGKPYIAFGTPGSDTQPQTQLQFFLNVVDFGMNVQQALEAPAVISSNFESSYYPHVMAGKLMAPVSLPKPVLEGLAALGHNLDIRDVKGVGSVKAIIVHPRTGVLMGGVSPTGDNYAIGW
ncbi:MAG TPA: gamma-glutamyltransferase [Bryobacteraceae bacterium]|nr:gamma-glutamyltransferase [Bryobacteraceae bacterium]